MDLTSGGDIYVGNSSLRSNLVYESLEKAALFVCSDDFSLKSTMC